MQLSGAPRPAPAPAGQLFSPFTRTLLALLVITVPALGGVLPDDRADVLWHDYNGGDITVSGPEVLVRKKVGDNLSLSAGYYEDMISSASIDVKLSASPYHEVRKQENAGIDFLHGKTTYSAGYIHSREPDYIADTTYYSVSQDMFGDLTTVTMGYRRGWDQIFRDIKTPDGVIENDPTFHERADHHGYSLSISQILTRNLIANLNYELLTDQGYLANPYRKIRYLSPGMGMGFTLADQVYPNTRTSNAASVQLKYYLPWRAALTAQYRFYRDTWGVVANTGELDCATTSRATPTSTATCSRVPTTRTSWRATGNWPPSTPTPSVRAPPTSSTCRMHRGSTGAPPTCASITCWSNTAISATRCSPASSAPATSRSTSSTRTSSRSSSPSGSDQRRRDGRRTSHAQGFCAHVRSALSFPSSRCPLCPPSVGKRRQFHTRGFLSCASAPLSSPCSPGPSSPEPLTLLTPRHARKADSSPPARCWRNCTPGATR
jgi:hypothetical protein